MRHPKVPGAHADLAEVADHGVGPGVTQRAGAPGRPTPITDANPAARAASTPAAAPATTTARPGRTFRSAAARAAPSAGTTAVPTPTSRSRAASVEPRSVSRSNSTASWRRGSMMTGMCQPSHGDLYRTYFR
ncbi:phosphohistidine phosphatase domain protein [Mycobacterium intracellulare MIN_061107_1834]|nr:phosphohistidine phosphatase domain protein [Mycobacterium intracellulare MIN_061107_1834]